MMCQLQNIFLKDTEYMMLRQLKEKIDQLDMKYTMLNQPLQNTFQLDMKYMEENQL